MSRKIAIFDTTLRDGEQPPGVSMNTEGNIVIARQLVRMNVDVIEPRRFSLGAGDWQDRGRPVHGMESHPCGRLGYRSGRRSPQDGSEAPYPYRPGISPSHLRDKLHMTEDEASISRRP